MATKQVEVVTFDFDPLHYVMYRPNANGERNRLAVCTDRASAAIVAGAVNEAFERMVESTDLSFDDWWLLLRLELDGRGYTTEAISSMEPDDWREYHADGLSPIQAINADEAHA